MSIPITKSEPKDALIWAHSKYVIYDVKSAYMLGKSCNFDLLHQVWVDVWRLDVSPKVHHILWRACTDTLLVLGTLKYRHMADNDKCTRCNDGLETIIHALFVRPKVCSLWSDIGCYSLFLVSYNKGTRLPQKGTKLRQKGTKAVTDIGCFANLYISWNNKGTKLRQK